MLITDNNICFYYMSKSKIAHYVFRIVCDVEWLAFMVFWAVSCRILSVSLCFVRVRQFLIGLIFIDPLDEMGSRSSLSRDVEGADHWDMNYHEAAIYLEVIM